MFSISYEIGGRKINPRNLKDILQKAMIDSITEDIEKKLKLLDVILVI